MNESDKVEFLELLAEIGLERTVAKRLDIPYRLVAQAKREDKDWATEINETLLDFKETVEAQFYQRALRGTAQAIYDKNGQHINTTYIQNDNMLIKLVKALDPEKYSDKQQLTGANSGPVEILIRNIEDGASE